MNANTGDAQVSESSATTTAAPAGSAPTPPPTTAPVDAEGRYAPVIVGHRGAALVAPENTMASFERAQADGATVVECDVHLSKDGSVIVMHDETIERTIAAHSPLTAGALGELTDEQLATVVLDGDHHVPHLEELLAMRDLELYVEVKVAEAATAAARLIHELRPESGRRDTVISFVPEALLVVKREAPEVQLGLLLDHLRPGAWEFMTDNEIGWLSCSVDGLTEADATLARQRGLKINVWTVNSLEQLRRAVALRPDSISTDDPAWAIRELPGLIDEARA